MTTPAGAMIPPGNWMSLTAMMLAINRQVTKSAAMATKRKE
jgi:hypothetical protein